MAKIGNFTGGHSLDFFKREETYFDPQTRKYYLNNPDESKPFLSIAPSGMLSAVFAPDEITGQTEQGVPLVARRVESATPIPEGYDYVVVSPIYINAVPFDSRLYTVIDPVLDTPNKGRIVGCLGIGRVEF